MCIDQYHQNDKIYQLEVETQTMMEKLKLQEKRIKANCVTYDKLTHQKYEYQRRLEYYGYQIEQLEKDSK